MKAFQPHEIHRTREANVAFNTTNRFLADNQSELAALLKTLGWHELAERLASYAPKHSLDPRHRSEIERDLCEALDFLSEAPFNPDSSWGGEWSDFDAAIRWFGARLEDLRRGFANSQMRL